MKRIIKFIFTTSFFLVLLSCSKSPIEIDNLRERISDFEKNENPILGLDGNPIDGVVYSDFKNGHIKNRVTIEQGVPIGYFESFFENGQLESKLPFKDGKVDGIYEQFYSNGILETRYSLISGKIEGERKKYYPSGKLREISFYRTDKREGESKGYHENGKLMYTQSYFNDKEMGQGFFYYENGEIQSFMTFEYGIIDGPFGTYTEDGIWETRGEYKDGKIEELEKKVYPGGFEQKDNGTFGLREEKYKHKKNH
jgi:antitoxin component YwqK of YwqJK toxin-antitoxin module